MTEQVKHYLREIFETIVLMLIVGLLVFIGSRIINIEINESSSIELDTNRNQILNEISENLKLISNKK